MNPQLKLILVLFGIATASSADAFELKSADLKAGETIPMEYVFNGMGCKGKNVSPELHWSGAPAGTKSYAVTVYDPDAPTGSGFWHWIVIGISEKTTSLHRGWKSPSGDTATEIAADYGMAAYGGPCPPPGEPHRYRFTVHALKTDKLDIPAGATNAVVRFMLYGATIETASFTARYGQK